MVRPATRRERPTRRERLRVETLQEIQATARRLLVTEGLDGLLLRGIARAMGMSAPALYRYYASREDLVAALVVELKSELTQVLEAARDAEPADDVIARLLAVCREFRRWAVANRAEFTLMFTSPGLGLERTPGDEKHEAGQRFAQVFGALVAQLYLERPFPIPADDEIEEPLANQLATWCESFPMALPLGVTQVFLSGWIRLYGSVSMELFGQLEFALHDAGPMFEAELRDLATLVGIGPEDWRPAVRAG
jgi:AcrR family transcriptional regulator